MLCLERPWRGLVNPEAVGTFTGAKLCGEAEINLIIRSLRIADAASESGVLAALDGPSSRGTPINGSDGPLVPSPTHCEKYP